MEAKSGKKKKKNAIASSIMHHQEKEMGVNFFLKRKTIKIFVHP